MPQTSYSLTMTAGFEGQLIDRENAQGISSEFVNAETGYLPYGLVVVHKPAGNFGELILPTSGSQIVAGITHLENIHEKDVDGKSGVPSRRSLTVLTKGTVWVWTEQAIALADLKSVFYRFTANAPNLQLGRFRKDADLDVATPRAAQLLGAQFLRPAAANSLVPLVINLP